MNKMRTKKILTGVPENKDKWNHRIFIGTPTTGNIRMEWATARWGQVIPTCWSSIDHNAWVAPFAPLEYSVPDAQNLIVKAAIDAKAEWLFLLEHDNVIPPDTFLRLNQYMLKGDVPVVSGLYFTKSVPPEPLLYRGRGKGHYTDWKLGEKVWVDGVPTGVLLVSMRLMKALWDDSPEYKLGDITTRRVFDVPMERWYDAETSAVHSTTGTSDLNFCTRVIEGDYIKKAGFTVKDPKNPFLVDTKIFSTHIDNSGKQYPLDLPKSFVDGGIDWKEALHSWD